MGFLAPFALVGLAAALVPPLLHLFQRRRPPAVEFPAVRYLQQTEREAERRIRLQHLLLMLLRVAAVVLIVLAAARPVVPRGFGALHEPTAVAIVLDNSLSSGAVTGGARVLDALAERARETLREARSGDALWLLGADGLARRGTSAELLAAVDAVRPDARRLELGSAVRTAARLVATSGYVRGEVHVLSDLQRSAFEECAATIAHCPLPDSAAGQSATGNRQSAMGNGKSASREPLPPVLFYHPAADPPPNLGVAEAKASPPLWLPGSGAVTARIAGAAGDVSAQAALVLDGRSGARALARAGGSVTLAAPRLTPGWHVGAVELVPDELRGDDARAVAVRVVPPAAVTAEGEAALGPFARQALDVLAEAGHVRLGGGEISFGTTLRLPAGSGGVSVVVPPADAVQLGAVNRSLAAGGVPWRFGPRVERADSLVSALVPEVAGARVRARYRLTAERGADTAAVLARSGGDPWLVRHQRVVLVASRLVPEETDLPLGSRFVPFLTALLNRVARGEAGVLSAAPGEAVTLPARARSLVAGDSGVAVDGGGIVAAPATPGAYPVLAGRDTIAMLVVGPDPRESELARATVAELRSRLAGFAVSVTDDPRDYGARRFRGAGRSELTGWMLLLALGVLIGEALLAAGGVGRTQRS